MKRYNSQFLSEPPDLILLIDDIFFCAWVADEIMKQVGEGIVDENWDGECPVIPLIQGILAGEGELLGDQKEKILAYVGIG